MITTHSLRMNAGDAAVPVLRTDGASKVTVSAIDGDVGVAFAPFEPIATLTIGTNSDAEFYIVKSGKSYDFIWYDNNQQGAVFLASLAQTGSSLASLIQLPA